MAPPGLFSGAGHGESVLLKRPKRHNSPFWPEWGRKRAVFPDFLMAEPGEPGFWQLAGSSVSVDGCKVVSGFDTILQTGETLTYGPPGAVQEVYAKIPGAKPFKSVPGFYQFPCHTKPEVSFGWGGKQWNISARE